MSSRPETLLLKQANSFIFHRFALFNHPLRNLRHIADELGWLFTKGIPRAMRMLVGRERFRVDERILNEGYSG